MKLILGFLFVMFMVYESSSTITKIHNCFPSSFSGICTLGHVFYNHSQDITHVFPQNYSFYRIGSDGWSKGIDSVIPVFDLHLQALLGDPPAVEIIDSEVERLEIPRALRWANFADNRLSSFWIEEGSVAEPILSYLDLGRNSISNLTNITAFVNLETVYLYNNRIKAVELHVFKNLTKLKVLNLNYNQIATIPGDSFPASLTYLGLYYNDLKALNYSALQLDSLEVLNVERNAIEAIDAAKLLLGLPKLIKLRMGGNLMSQEAVLDTIEILKRRNVSYRDESEQISCYYDNEEIEGVCVNRQAMTRGWFKALVLSILTILIAILFVLLVRWVFIAMNK